MQLDFDWNAVGDLDSGAHGSLLAHTPAAELVATTDSELADGGAILGSYGEVSSLDLGGQSEVRMSLLLQHACRHSTNRS